MKAYNARISGFTIALKEKDYKNLVGVEVGVFDGSHCWGFLENLDIKELYMIDPYASYPAHIKDVGLERSKWLLARAKKRSFNWANEKFPEKCFHIYEKSLEAVHRFKNESLDFVYLDGDHTYKNVSKEIPLWDAKLKSGGLMGGHDYSKRRTGVMKAVNEYCKKRSIKFEVVRDRRYAADWFYWKK